MRYCNTDDEDDGKEYCKRKTNNKFNHCWKLSSIAYTCLINNEKKECDGFCIPKDVPCEFDNDCKAIGTLFSGRVFAQCENEVCTYGRYKSVA